MKRKFNVQVKIIGCDKIFKEGLAPGVIGSKVVTVTLKEGESTVSLPAFIYEQGEKLMNKCCELVIDETT